MMLRMSKLSFFQVIPDFDHQSARPVCYVSNLPKQYRKTPQQKESQLDEFILRGPSIDFEGHLDIRPAVILQTAQELGMVPAEEVDRLVRRLSEVEEGLKNAEYQATAANSRLTDQILQNAEQIVEIQGLKEELESVYEEQYSAEDDLEADDVA